MKDFSNNKLKTKFVNKTKKVVSNINENSSKVVSALELKIKNLQRSQQQFSL